MKLSRRRVLRNFEGQISIGAAGTLNFYYIWKMHHCVIAGGAFLLGYSK